MQAIYDFINECGPFFVLTSKDDKAIGRPFGAIMLHDNKLYISTSNQKEVYKQIKANKYIQLLSFRYGSRDWLRVNAIATEVYDLKIKDLMLERCTAIRKHYYAADDPKYVVFALDIIDYEKQ